MFITLFLWQLLTIVVSVLSTLLTTHDSLIVSTTTGKIKGFKQKTFLSNTPYISYRGIPYAEEPVGELRFKAPKAKTPWTNVLETNEKFGNACIAVANLFGVYVNQSENCLYLNVYQPAEIKIGERLAVLFFIPGGGFFDGDGSDQYYGADHFMEKGRKVILVTINYRLGPFGFANLDDDQFSGNMGLKDQAMALEWVFNNIYAFHGNRTCITVFGQSSGAASTNYLILSKKRRYIKRAIHMSGSSLTYWATSESNNHLSLLMDLFAKELNNKRDKSKLKELLKTISADDIVSRTSTVFGPSNGPVFLYWSPVVERKTAKDAIITEDPRIVYENEKSKINIDTMFSITGSEYLFLLNPSQTPENSNQTFGWVDPLNANFNIDPPVHNLVNSSKMNAYIEAMRKRVRKFYFGTGKLGRNERDLYKYVRMMSDINFDYPIAETTKLQAAKSNRNTFYYRFNVQLGLNFVKKSFKENIEGSSHCEEIPYLFDMKAKRNLFNQIKNNPNTIENKKTLAAINFMTDFFTHFAKTGSVYHFKTVGDKMYCIEATNNGLRQIIAPNSKGIQMWGEICQDLRKLNVTNCSEKRQNKIAN